MTLLTITTALFFLTTVVFAIIAFLPDVSPISPASTDADEEVLEVARRFSENLVNFDHQSLDEDLTKIEGDITGSFEEQFHAALGGDINVFRQAIRESEATSTGEVKGASVSSRDDDTATVLVVVSQTVRNRENPESRTQLRPLELTLVKTDGGWKVDNVGNPATTTS